MYTMLYIFLLLTNCYVTLANNSEIIGDAEINNNSKIISDAEVFLVTYGYLNHSNTNFEGLNNEKFSKAIKTFQTNYNLQSKDGVLNNETIQLMSKSRCGVSDVMQYNVYKYKWNHNIITWTTPSASLVDIITEAFHVWELNANISFVYREKDYSANIIVSNGRKKHFNYARQRFSMACSDQFDGTEGVLGHAYLPNLDQRTVEIHMDSDENWNYNTEFISNVRPSYFVALVHEIGHSLGISHSYYPQSIMYAYYKFENIDMLKIITQDDKDALVELYGSKPIAQTTTTKTTTTTTTTTAKPANAKITKKFTIKKTTTSTPLLRSTQFEQEKENVPNLCDVDISSLKTFIIINQQLYIFYKKWYWSKHLNDDNSINYKAELIRRWLPFLPENFNKIDAIYERPNSNIVVFSHNKIYNIKYPSLELDVGLNVSSFSIKAALTTYKGQSYLFYDKNVITKINNCNNNVEEHGYIYDKFFGVPTNITSVFRYTNGILYFVKNNTYFAYNEFLNKVVDVGTFNLSLFNIECASMPMYKKLANLMSQLLSYYKNM